MKRRKIKDRLDKAIRSSASGGCFLYCDRDYFNIIPLKRSENTVLAVHDDDFAIDGYLIIPIDGIESFRLKTDEYNRIMNAEGINRDIPVPDICLDTMRAACESIYMKDEFISIYRSDGRFYIGKIVRVGKHSIRFRGYDADGIWLEPVKIPVREIGVIVCGDRYTDVFSKYVR